MNKIMAKVCTGRWISLFGEFVQAAVLPIIFYKYTSSSLLLSAAFISETLPWVLVTPNIIGYIEKKLKDSFVLKFCALSKAILIFLLACFIEKSIIVLGIFFLLGIINSLYSSYNMKLMKVIIPENESEKSLGIILAIDDVISIIAPIIVTFFIFLGLSLELFLWLNASFKFINYLILKLIKIKEGLDKTNTDIKKSSSLKIGKNMMRNKKIRYLIEIEFLRSVFEGILMPILIVIVLDGINAKEEIYTMGVLVAAISQVIFSILYVKISKSMKDKIIVIYSTILICVTLVILTIVTYQVVYLIAMFFLGAGLAIRQLVAENIMLKLPSQDNIKSWTSNYNAIIATGYLVGYGLSIIKLKTDIFILMSLVLMIITLYKTFKFRDDY